ncbi:MAG: NADPH-dependent glutamate synthase [Elusimicrobiota bacterium]|jgi:glutamate synthase (NADPH/NADH) small chain|nr:NADPH-dependent glutamate synthase [Elusimicrobiota bacterium]
MSRIAMPQREAEIRNKDFIEVNTGYTDEQALAEAKRCLKCPKPMCVQGCPVEIEIPAFIGALSDDNPFKAAKILKGKNSLSAVCGRVCPQEKQCEKHCILGKKDEPIAIGNLERYTADWAAENIKEKNISVESKGIKVAVIGSGPAGLTCAGDLAKAGYETVIYESLHNSGGVLRYGIPEFRLPKSILDYEIDALKKAGVSFKFNTLIGRTITIDELFKDNYKAIFIGSGAGLPTFMGIEGENLKNIYSANEFLSRVNLMRAADFPEYDTPVYKGSNVIVVGGGNTAMDSVRTAKRLGADTVTLVYPRSEAEMPDRLEEKIHAKEEGVQFMPLTNPIRFIGDDKHYFVTQVECLKMELGEPDASGRRKPQEIAGSNFTIEADCVILALGLNPNPVLTSLTKGLKTNERGRIIIDDNLMSSIPGVFAGGDIAGGSTVIEAMGMGKQAARKIMDYLNTLK